MFDLQLRMIREFNRNFCASTLISLARCYDDIVRRMWKVCWYVNYLIKYRKTFFSPTTICIDSRFTHRTIIFNVSIVQSIDPTYTALLYLVIAERSVYFSRKERKREKEKRQETKSYCVKGKRTEENKERVTFSILPPLHSLCPFKKKTHPTYLSNDCSLRLIMASNNGDGK